MSLLFRLRLPVRRRLEGTFLLAVIFHGASATPFRLLCCGRRTFAVRPFVYFKSNRIKLYKDFSTKKMQHKVLDKNVFFFFTCNRNATHNKNPPTSPKHTKPKTPPNPSSHPPTNTAGEVSMIKMAGTEEPIIGNNRLWGNHPHPLGWSNPPTHPNEETLRLKALTLKNKIK